ncbi:DUF4382 domain-containing protein [Salinimicrobium soli]|uniref:DUF4382 domain-containing protein n=1 Tax=Salinimicrobium soli TaxID=1254399 RepID=UPI003AB096F2
MKKYQLFVMCLALTAGLFSCSKDDSANSEGTAKVAVKLTDAPGEYAEVWVDVQDVLIKTTVEGSEEEGWESIGNVKPDVINLLELTGGVTELLAESEVPAGFIHQMRLVLGTNNSIVLEKDGPHMVLNTPSGQQSGLKLNIDQELQADAEYIFTLDFDVDKSVVQTTEGAYNLKPVIRVSREENSGTISGTVVADSDVLVTATSATTEVSAYTNAEGKFELHGLPAGTYLVTATPEEGLGLVEAQISPVVVQAGATVKLDPIYLQGE